mgnify:CR=1 FL=1
MTGALVVGSVGAVTAAGTGVPALVEALAQPRWQPELGLPRPDAPPLPVATCRGFSPQGHLPPLVARRLDRPARLLAVAAREALRAIGEGLPWPRDEVGVSAGTGNAGTDALVEVLKAVFFASPEEAPPMRFPSTVANAPASQLAILEKLGGPNLTFAEKQAGGLRAVVEAARLLQRRRAVAVLACGVDEAQWLNAEAYHRLRFSRRFLHGRGAILGEGAAVLLLTPPATLPPLARLAGWGAAALPAPTHLYPASGEALARAIAQAVGRAGLTAADLDLVVSLHSGAPHLATLEVDAILAVLGDRRPAALAVTDRLGEGAFASALRALVAVLALAGTPVAWPAPSHLAALGFPDLTSRPRTALVTAVAGGGSAVAAVLTAP